MGGMRVSAYLRARGSVAADLLCPVIWPCDIQGFWDHEGNMAVVNYILDDVSNIRPPIPSQVLTRLFRRISRNFWSTHSRLGLG